MVSSQKKADGHEDQVIAPNPWWPKLSSILLRASSPRIPKVSPETKDWVNTKKAADIGLRHMEKAELTDDEAKGKFHYRKGDGRRGGEAPRWGCGGCGGWLASGKPTKSYGSYGHLFEWFYHVLPCFNDQHMLIFHMATLVYQRVVNNWWFKHVQACSSGCAVAVKTWQGGEICTFKNDVLVKYHGYHGVSCCQICLLWKIDW